MTKKILEDFEFNEIKSYVIFLESTVPYDEGIFYTFSTEHDVINVMKNEILEFSGVEAEDLSQYQEELDQVLPASISGFDEDTLEKINVLLTHWKVGYIGTLENLLVSQSHSATWLRKQFRQHSKKQSNSSPIELDEVEDFKNWMLPDWA